ncbi:DUF2332 domain-containing protein [Pseudoroseomonas cervicalis]|uniref:DUF2332 domain-containing protein n=1 Tax=Teichococcus cervicalis TaxID=204525 RepID=UPI00278773D9|nr:DUF2332 domain-containing protein [Pseudoroseomonas cervicalis]MDQ1081985.1 hypothetical protein [Pseudoroseomonas cervicalis]
MPATDTTDAVLHAFGQQIEWCERLGSPLTARLLRWLSADIAAGGLAAPLVAAWPGDPLADALALRLAGGLHALVLAGQAPALAACYPPNPAPADAALAAALRAVLAARQEELRGFLASAPQTNEVGRAGVLLGGFLEIAAATRLPLALLEIGASAGLNLAWDRFSYRLGEAAWGDPASPVQLRPEWRGALPPLDAPLAIATRAGCDLAPMSAGDPAQALRLRAYVWPDQRDRLARLEGAIALARRLGTQVERADALDWLRPRLHPGPGRATVLYHSIMWQYLPAATQDGILALLRQAAAQATARAPLAWLRFEMPPAGGPPELRLTLWPDGTERRLAIAHPHGQSVDWLGG